MEGNSNGTHKNTQHAVKGSQQPNSSPSSAKQTKKKQFTPIIPKEPYTPKSNSNTNASDNNNNVNDGIIRIKRKRADNALDSFVIEDEPDHKRVTLSSITDKLSQVSVDTEKKPTYNFAQSSPSSQPPPKTQINNRKLFRFAYTITDAAKMKEHNKGLLKIQSVTKRDQVVQSKRAQTPTSASSEDPYVIDVYVQDTDVKPDSDLLDQFDVVRLESFNEDLVFDNEYDSDNGSEDSNAENHYGNEYPEEEVLTDESFSDDSEKENLNSRIRFDSDDEYDDYDNPYVKPDLTKFEKFLRNEDSEENSDEDHMDAELTRKAPPTHLTFTPQRNTNGKTQPTNMFHTLKNQQIAAKKKQKEQIKSLYAENLNADDYNYEVESSSDSDLDVSPY